MVLRQQRQPAMGSTNIGHLQLRRPTINVDALSPDLYAALEKNIMNFAPRKSPTYEEKPVSITTEARICQPGIIAPHPRTAVAKPTARLSSSKPDTQQQHALRGPSAPLSSRDPETRGSNGEHHHHPAVRERPETSVQVESEAKSEDRVRTGAEAAQVHARTHARTGTDREQQAAARVKRDLLSGFETACGFLPGCTRRAFLASDFDCDGVVSERDLRKTLLRFNITNPDEGLQVLLARRPRNSNTERAGTAVSRPLRTAPLGDGSDDRFVKSDQTGWTYAQFITEFEPFGVGSYNPFMPEVKIKPKEKERKASEKYPMEKWLTPAPKPAPPIVYPLKIERALRPTEGSAYYCESSRGPIHRSLTEQELAQTQRALTERSMRQGQAPQYQTMYGQHVLNTYTSRSTSQGDAQEDEVAQAYITTRYKRIFSRACADRLAIPFERDIRPGYSRC